MGWASKAKKLENPPESQSQPAVPTPQQMFQAMGANPDPWQQRFITDRHPRQIVLACRRAGKSFAAAVKTLHHCLTTPNATTLVLSPTMRQSREFSRYVRNIDRAIKFPLDRVSENQSEVEWSNGSRLLSLPDNHEGVVGFTPSLVVIDEASRVSDPLYKSIRPMLGLGASFLAISTPFGQRGWFYEVWDTPPRLARFHHWRVTADECPRISKEFLSEELLELGDRWFRQEWYCTFENAVDSVFSKEVIDKMFDAQDIQPLFTDPIAA